MLILMALAMTGSGAWYLDNLRQNLIQRTDERLFESSEALAQQAAQEVLLTSPLASTQSTPDTERALQRMLPPQSYVQFYNPDGKKAFDAVSNESGNRPYLPSIDANQVKKAGGVPFTVNGTESKWRVRALHVSGTDYQVAIALPFGDDIDGIADSARNTMIGISLIALGLVGIVGWLAITNTFRPLRGIEKTAARIAAGDLSQRVASYPRDTELGHLSASLNTMLGKIETSFDGQTRSEKRIRQFVSDASHELRTPLVTIRGYAELYRQGAIAKPEDVGAAMLRIENEARRMGVLVEDLVVLARLDEKREQSMGPVDIGQIVRDAAADAAAQAPERDISLLGLDGEDVGPIPGVYGSESQLRQVIINLGGNAIRHTPPGSPIDFAVGVVDAESGRILTPRPAGTPEDELLVSETKQSPTGGLRVSSLLGLASGRGSQRGDGGSAAAGDDAQAQRSTAELRLGDAAGDDSTRIKPDIGGHRDVVLGPGPYVCFEIRDHGEGIGEGDLTRIFERFYRVDSSRNRDTGGSGLGLSIVRAIVDSHKGAVTVVETDGGGATFRVLLPVPRRRERTDQQPNTGEPGQNGSDTAAP